MFKRKLFAIKFSDVFNACKSLHITRFTFFWSILNNFQICARTWFEHFCAKRRQKKLARFDGTIMEFWMLQVHETFFPRVQFFTPINSSSCESNSVWSRVDYLINSFDSRSIAVDSEWETARDSQGSLWMHIAFEVKIFSHFEWNCIKSCQKKLN